MSTYIVTPHLIHSNHLADFYLTQDRLALANKLLRENKYSAESSILFHDLEDEEVAADELFDLTNNPFRQVEREKKYGRGRSVSVGDIVSVVSYDGRLKMFLCEPIGWTKI